MALAENKPFFSLFDTERLRTKERNLLPNYSDNQRMPHTAVAWLQKRLWIGHNSQKGHKRDNNARNATQDWKSISEIWHTEIVLKLLPAFHTKHRYLSLASLPEGHSSHKRVRRNQAPVPAPVTLNCKDQWKTHGNSLIKDEMWRNENATWITMKGPKPWL